MILSDMRREAAERFWEKVDKTDDCWNWTAYKLQGYGRFGVGSDQRPAVVYAHRWAYEALVGPIPEGLTLDHLCRNRACVNPDHLEPVTPAENTRRGGWSLKTHCPQGHRYDEANTIIGKGAHGPDRRCRECNRQRCEARSRALGIIPKLEKTHCKNGHEWTPENTYQSKTRRACRACTLAAQKRYQARKRGE